MFSLLYGLYTYLFTKQEHAVLIVGLDGAGKSTLLERLKVLYDRPERALPPEKITPTVGLNIARLNLSRYRLLVWDLGGQRQLRALWQKYYAQANAIIFVVDACDATRFPEATTTIRDLAVDPLLTEVPLLVFANKQDRPGASTAAQMVRELHLDQVGRRPCRAVDLCALTGDGVREGIEWLTSCVGSVPRRLPADA
eukprot:TRINITY_DN46274_c0_g1_i1.p1 TRINITY_DN46274_c0_g1~~TRINITY_DN46274_c0_g1_i1.p1  ORF type:complete len:197 (+),score=22.87 TRINITY_DN46274_c0_g1_i1:123-713(+)